MKFFLALALSTLAVAVPVVVTPDSNAITAQNNDRVVHYANAVPEDIAKDSDAPPAPKTDVDSSSDDTLTRPKTNIKTPATPATAEAAAGGRPPFKDNRNLRYANDVPTPVQE